MVVGGVVGWLLCMDTATRRGNLVLARVGDSGTSGRDIHLRCYEGAQDHAERLLREVDGLLSEARVRPAEIEKIAVGVGPGSFTGVRAGVVTAKALAFASGASLVPVGSLEAMARACGAPPGPRIAVIDARRDELFAAAYDPDGGALLPPTHVARAGLAAWLAPLAGSSGVLLGEVELPELVGFSWHRSPETDLPGGLALLELALTRPAVSEATLEPTYLRPPDAALPAAGLSLAARPRLDSATPWTTSAHPSASDS